MYTKLTQDFLKKDFNDWESLRGDNLLNSYDSFTTRLEYFNISNLDLFRSIHCKRIFTIRPDRVRFSRITGKGILYPHKDHDTTAVLNYYISTSDDPTIFYKQNEGAKAFSYPGRKQENIFNPDDLVEIGRFNASSNDVYLLNVSEIHSVEKSDLEPRLFISYLWNSASYDDVLNDIINTKDK
jgi:hypothetical protein